MKFCVNFYDNWIKNYKFLTTKQMGKYILYFELNPFNIFNNLTIIYLLIWFIQLKLCQIICDMICFGRAISMHDELSVLNYFLFVRNFKVYIIVGDFIYRVQITMVGVNLHSFTRYFYVHHFTILRLFMQHLVPKC